MNPTRRPVALGTITAALLISGFTISTASADAGDAAHAWNDSNSTDKCLAASDNQFTANVIMWTCESQGGQEWSASRSEPSAVTATPSATTTVASVSRVSRPGRAPRRLLKPAT